jgi:DNA-binding response OmpR family regulator
MHRILCVEDSPEVRLILEATLRDHQVTFASTAREATAILSRDRFDLVLMDIELPDGNGLELMATWADQLRHTPVIFLTGKKDFASKVSAFSLGAEDFVLKPFDPQELKLRVDSKLRKASRDGEEKTLLRIGPVICNLAEQRLFKNNGHDTIDLTTLEFRVFHLLAQTPNKIFSRTEILERAWGESVSVTNRAVDVHISNLRKKLIGSGVGIEAVIGAGYRILLDKVI